MPGPTCDAVSAIAALTQALPGTLVTQNVDGLHQAAGSRGVVELHGSLARARCTGCGATRALDAPPSGVPGCSECGSPLRPDVVWFGEHLPEEALVRAEAAFERASVALVVGTSGLVWPAAGLAHAARERDAEVIVVDPNATALDHVATHRVWAEADAGLEALLGALDGTDGGPA